MIEITGKYWNEIANQTIIISSLLDGFSITVIAGLIVSNNNSKLSKGILKASTLAASFFLITVFTMNKILLMTTTGFPIKVTEKDIFLPRTIGTITFFFRLNVINNNNFISRMDKIKKKWVGSLQL